MNNALRFTCAAALLGLGGLAQADVYVGAGGYATAAQVSVAGKDLDENDFAPAIFVGWRPLELVGVEAGYYDLGSYDIAGTKVEASATTLAGLLSFELGPVGVYLKGGVAGNAIQVAGKNDNSTDPFGGLGISFDAMDKLYVYGEVLRFTNDAKVDIDVVGAGVRWAF